MDAEFAEMPPGAGADIVGQLKSLLRRAQSMESASNADDEGYQSEEDAQDVGLQSSTSYTCGIDVCKARSKDTYPPTPILPHIHT